MNWREKFCAGLFEISKGPYRFLFKRKNRPWELSADDLCNYPENSLGHEVGLFLKKNQFELIPKLESHDVYHVICQMDTSVRDEIGMQYLLMGNGKKSTYQKLTVVLGFCLLPEYYTYFKFCYKKGQQMRPVYQLDLYDSLNLDYQELLDKFKIQKHNDHFKLFTLIED